MQCTIAVTGGGNNAGRNENTPGMVGLAPKWVRLAPNGTNPGLFQIRFQCIWRRGAKCTEIWSEKAPDLSHFEPIWPTLEPNLPSLQWSVSAGMADWASNWARLASNGTNLGLFKISLLLILAPENWSLKVPCFVPCLVPIWPIGVTSMSELATS